MRVCIQSAWQSSNTRLADVIGKLVVNWVLPFGPLGLVAGAYLLMAFLSQVIAGQVTTLITAPVLISAAISLHSNPQAVAVVSAIACSTSFLTPLAHPVNALMIGPANYKFTDFFRVGWGLTVLSFVMLLIGMSLFWKL
ncbi:MAG: anion permease [Aggregatilineales bacterium]